MSDSDDAMHSMSSDQLNNCLDLCVFEPEDSPRENELEGASVATAFTGPCFRKDVSLSDFYVSGRIGTGSCATVMLAESKECGRQYAIKVISKRYILRHNMADYIRTEHDILKTLSDDGVCKMHFAFEDKAAMYIGLEHCSGGELYMQIRKFGSLPLSLVRFYAADIVLMLEHLRGHGVIHRDLKPENLLLTDTGHLKLIDFGSAKVVKTAAGSSARVEGIAPRATTLVGTAEYVAPEVVLNEGVSFSSDLWALGCTIFHMLTGRTPFKARTQQLTFQRVVSGAFDIPDDVPFVAHDLLERLLNLRPEQRLGAQDLDELKAHEFFDGVQWDTLRSDPPPELLSPTDSGESDVTEWTTTSLAAFADVEASLPLAIAS